jgi:hypothetical protein
MKLLNTSILAKKSRRIDRIIREAKETEVYPKINRENGFSLGRSWKSLTRDLREQKQALNRNAGECRLLLLPSSPSPPA